MDEAEPLHQSAAPSIGDLPCEDPIARSIGLLARAGQQAAAVVQREGAIREACDLLLEAALLATGSNYGFCGKCQRDDAGNPYLFTLALTNIAWNAETAKVYAGFLDAGLAFRNLDTLFGNVLVTGQVMLTRDAPNHPKAGGVPPGHPALERFLGIPIKAGNEVIGQVGLANFDPALRDEELNLIAELIALASVGSLSLSKASDEADTFRRVRSVTRYDLLRRTVGGFAHQFNNELMCLRVGMPMLQRMAGEDAEGQDVFVEMEDSLVRMANVSHTLERFAIAADSALRLQDVTALAQQLIKLLTMSECDAEVLSPVDGFALSVSEQIAMSWLVEALMTALGPRRRDDCIVLRLTMALDHKPDALVTFSISGDFDIDSSADAIFTLADECHAFGAEVRLTEHCLELVLPAYRIMSSPAESPTLTGRSLASDRPA